MIYTTRGPLGALFFACTIALAALAAPGARAQEGLRLRIVVSPYTAHFRPGAEHKPVWALGGEIQRRDGWLAGGAYFSNSFGQPSGYLYAGRRYDDLLGHRHLYAQWSAGVIYGYRGPWKHKLPMNSNGYAPGLIASLGWQFDGGWSVAAHLLGDAGVMLQLGYELR
ncbi:MAG: hypothetical protein KGL18_10370 [Burkholderiales bacterium]|nr:hypothetical protein [Burkholderiales bacterium]MDE1928181.1 hypothetical protein [Burkholderiales bacterium]MDE2158811.1 hypothetical protein [Burkholderiales bacterium]MDE2503365.1 hypothetical protein [Burkholderiales bacterium]